MYLLLLHCLILLGTSFGAARHLAAQMVDRSLAAVVLGWGNIVVTSLLLAGLHRLGDPAWFIRTSLTLAAVTWWLLRRRRLMQGAIMFSTAAAVIISAVIGLLFISAYITAQIGTLIAFLWVLTMALLVTGLGFFLMETRLAAIGAQLPKE